MSARASAPRTSRTPEKDGVPFTVIMAQAAEVSAWRFLISYSEHEGRSSSARVLAGSDTASAASIVSTAGSSRVDSDFSNSSMLYPLNVKSDL